jgi:dienelactone hydrolase
MIEQTAVYFDSGGATCAASLYRPAKGDGLVSCLVMAHGTSGTKDLGLAAYAERFAAAGLAVLVFDYRHFGASGGHPRQLIHIRHQLEDYHAAIRFARGLPGVDPERIALWGTSLSGGHVLVVAATDARIAAVVAQVPWVGIEFGRASPRSQQATRKLFVAAFRDALHGLLRRPPYLIKVVGQPGELAAFTDADARGWMEVMASGAPTWRNAIAARVLFSMLLYRPGTRAKQLAMPLLVCIADQDTAGSTALALRAARQARHAEVRHYLLPHFAVYAGEGFERVIADQITFLQAHLLTGKTAGQRDEGARV